MNQPGSEDGAVYRKVVPASRRYGTMKRTDLTKNLSDLQDVQQKLEMLLEEMSTIGVNRLQMDGVTKFSRGMDLISAFLVKLDQAIARER